MLPHSERPRILFIPQWYPSIDGSERISGTFCREHVRAAALYDDVAVLVFSGRQERWPTLHWKRTYDGTVPTFYATYGMSPIPKTTRPFFYLHLRRAFNRILEEWGCPDVIHTQDGYGYYVIKALASFKIPFVISQHSTAFMEGTVDRRTARRLGWAFDRAVRVLPANQFAQKDYEPYGLSPRTTWLPNALDTDVFYPSEQTREPWLLHASGFTAAKRFPDIVKAFGQTRSQRPNAVLQVVGDGAQRAAMEALAIRELPPRSYRFHGFLSKERLADLMRRCCGFVFASDAETFGCVLMEAMACGCPVLTTRVGGIPAVVRDGDGLFVEVGAIDEIAGGMRRLLDGAHGLDLARISRETSRRFSHETVGRLLHDEHMRAAKVYPGGWIPEAAGPEVSSRMCTELHHEKRALARTDSGWRP
jgi:glycosyltransferase involved in cell wall biosynthesis